MKPSSLTQILDYFISLFTGTLIVLKVPNPPCSFYQFFFFSPKKSSNSSYNLIVLTLQILGICFFSEIREISCLL